MKIVSLKSTNFRHFSEDTEVSFGDRITVISGQNGTGKSSLLGWVAQLCKFDSENKQITGVKFEEDWGKIFRFCKENDYNKKYKVVFEIEENEIINHVELSTRFIPSVNRYKCDFDRNIKGSPKRAIQFPLIYLGLRRLIPLSTESENKIKKNNIQLSASDISLFNSLSKEILLLIDESITPDAVKSPNKNVLAMKTMHYNHLGNSAGQDNIGQILAAIISFTKLKEKLGTEYKGGILLIDEIDATLYAGSQIKLLTILNKYATSLNLQVIFSTHSIEILEFISNEIELKSFIGKGSVINFLKTTDGIISNEINPSIDWIKLKIKALRGINQKPEKIDLICEDLSAELWIKNLIQNSDLKSFISIGGANLGKGTLSSMAKSNSKELQELKYVLDGDARKDKNIDSSKRNITFLPGESGVEIIMYHFIRSLPENDEFWNDSLNLTKQICFMNHQNSSNQNVAKAWFDDIDNKRDFFGRGYSKLFNRWKRDNISTVNEFLENLRNIL
ncbi:MAG: AAA family ATPase [Crocinitomicaceae bacterium]|nr:AAA family ATPase [Crocinitomicaceae bacterium]